ncbi:uncharacterized protein BBOV_IV000760 [Babesia bovis T2Bo]|uniref:Uncharacterized protein n=1 Tax=Babesia bovis TaxID=5865 RepID=A7AV48_BABBO|nr:uncharacterized protein BBOV_IV000760 [Babesia bovis T2Bo]EDO05674.1 hypothetical protein BBOV_IV000760 [Babesia bovis T2Bo]|eukprot:XP_001609242.1 hypothetical protein [Babesia bovis T2Bo]
MNAFGKVTKLVVASLTVATYVAASNVEAPMKPVCSASVPSTTPVKEGAKTESNLKGAVVGNRGIDKLVDYDGLVDRYGKVVDRIASYVKGKNLGAPYSDMVDLLTNTDNIRLPHALAVELSTLPHGPIPSDLISRLAKFIGTDVCTLLNKSGKYKDGSSCAWYSLMFWDMKCNNMKSFVSEALKSPSVLEV